MGRIEAKELRIGNLVYDAVENVHQITSINGVDLGLLGCSIELMFANPIPLTEDSFNKFKDVRKVSKEKYFIPLPKIKAEIHLVWYMKSWVVELYNWHSNLPIVLDTEFLHELQNLYFALTGEELTLKTD